MRNVWLSVKKIFVSSIYATSLFIATGLPQTAFAVSCNDKVPGQSFTYSEALVHFVYDGTKTYAIARSAVTGAQTIPDAFFAFSSGIDQTYRYSGVDTASLKTLLVSGRYGAARPPLVMSKEDQDFILKQFRLYLGDVLSTKSMCLNAWKEFGTGQPFLSMTDGSLSYTNWPDGVTPDVNLINEPQAVVMGLDGVWKNGENGQRLSQVVEFDGKLDCALDITTLPTEPPPLPEPPTTDVNAVDGVVCSQDVDLDGDISAEEYKNCVTTPQGEFCPVGALDCTASYQDAVCPDGTSLNGDRDMCQADPQVTCPTGFTWDRTIDKCVLPEVPCPEGGQFNGVTDRCEKTVLNECTLPYQLSSDQTYCFKPVDCSSVGGVFVPERDRCEAPPKWICTPPSLYVEATHRCESVPGCSVGQYMPETDQCQIVPAYYCSDPTYSYVLERTRCEKAPPQCAAGSYNGTYDLCLLPIIKTCDTANGYSYIAERDRCEKTPPNCSAGSNYNSVTNRCEITSTETGKLVEIYRTGGSCGTSATLLQAFTNLSPVISSTNFLRGLNNNIEFRFGNDLGSWTTNIYTSLLCAFNINVDRQPVNFTGNLIEARTPNNCQTPHWSWPEVSGDISSWSVIKYSSCSTVPYPSTLLSCTGPGYDGAANCSYDGAGAPRTNSITAVSTPPIPLSAIASAPQNVRNKTLAPGKYTCDGNSTSPEVSPFKYDACPTYAYDGDGNRYLTYVPPRWASGTNCSNSSANYYYDSNWSGYLDAGDSYCMYSGESDYCLPVSCVNAYAPCNSNEIDGTPSLTCTTPQYYCGGSIISSPTCSTVAVSSPTCPNGEFDPTFDVCYAPYTTSCSASGMYPDLNIGYCVGTPLCPNGSLDGFLDVCFQPRSESCPPTSTLINGMCYTDASCVGRLDPNRDVCYSPAAVDCSGFNWDSAIGVCFSAVPGCEPGVYTPEVNECRLPVTQNCGTYTWSEIDQTCVLPVTCPTDGSYALNNTIQYSSSLNKCVSDTEHHCIAGTTYIGVPVTMCEAIPICDEGAVKYEPSADACYVGDNTCPLGSQYSCMDYYGKMQCSANECFSELTPPGETVEAIMDESMYLDDARNPDGSCSGQIMIFGGKPSRCRPPGLKVGYINDCCESDQVMSEDVGNTAQAAVTAIKAMYQIGQVAYGIRV